MYYLNKCVGVATSPAFLGMMLFLLGFVLAILGRRRLAGWAAGLAAIWFLFWMSPATYRWLATGLEMQFPVKTVEQLPTADAIRILGGGVAPSTNENPYPEMWSSADRVWHGARLFKAGKAPRVFVTGSAEVPLLVDFGVPREAITICDGRNTEEEARFIAAALQAGKVADAASRPKILLVTSAWHMRRAKFMFERYAPGVEVIPAATDYEALVRCGWRHGLRWKDLIPDSEMLFQSSYMVKEIIGYWGYKWLRR